MIDQLQVAVGCNSFRIRSNLPESESESESNCPENSKNVKSWNLHPTGAECLSTLRRETHLTARSRFDSLISITFMNVSQTTNSLFERVVKYWTNLKISEETRTSIDFKHTSYSSRCCKFQTKGCFSHHSIWCRNRNNQKKWKPVKVQMLRFYSRAFGAHFRQDKSVKSGQINKGKKRKW